MPHTEHTASAEIRKQSATEKSSTTATMATTRNHQQIWHYRWKIKTFLFIRVQSSLSVSIGFKFYIFVLSSSIRTPTCESNNLKNKSIPFVYLCLCLFTLLLELLYKSGKNCECVLFFFSSFIIFRQKRMNSNLLGHHYFCP